MQLTVPDLPEWYASLICHPLYYKFGVVCKFLSVARQLSVYVIDKDVKEKLAQVLSPEVPC